MLSTKKRFFARGFTFWSLILLSFYIIIYHHIWSSANCWLESPTYIISLYTQYICIYVCIIQYDPLVNLQKTMETSPFFIGFLVIKLHPWLQQGRLRGRMGDRRLLWPGDIFWRKHTMEISKKCDIFHGKIIDLFWSNQKLKPHVSFWQTLFFLKLWRSHLTNCGDWSDKRICQQRFLPKNEDWTYRTWFGKMVDPRWHRDWLVIFSKNHAVFGHLRFERYPSGDLNQQKHRFTTRNVWEFCAETQM